MATRSCSAWTSAAARSPSRSPTVPACASGTPPSRSVRTTRRSRPSTGHRRRPRPAGRRRRRTDAGRRRRVHVRHPADGRHRSRAQHRRLGPARLRRSAATGLPGRGHPDGHRRQGGGAGRARARCAGRLRPRALRQPRHRPGGRDRQSGDGAHRPPRRGRRDRLQPARAGARLRRAAARGSRQRQGAGGRRRRTCSTAATSRRCSSAPSPIRGPRRSAPSSSTNSPSTW